MATPLPLVQCCAPLGSAALSEDEATELEQVFKALADRHRVKIVNRLIAAGDEAVCVCDFQDMLELKQSSVSYHLKQLLDAGIVEREKRGSFAYFSPRTGRARARRLPARPAGSRGCVVPGVLASIRPRLRVSRHGETDLPHHPTARHRRGTTLLHAHAEHQLLRAVREVPMLRRRSAAHQVRMPVVTRAQPLDELRLDTGLNRC